MSVKVDEKGMVTLDAHFKQWREIAERVRAQVVLIEAQGAFQKALEPILAGQKRWAELAASIKGPPFELPALSHVTRQVQKSMEPMIEAQRRSAELAASMRVPAFQLPDLSLLASQAAEFQKSLQGLMSPAFEQLEKSLSELPPRTQEALLLLGAHGWYLDLEMSLPELWELKEALSEGNVAKAEEALVDYFEGRLDGIEKSITKRFPHRAHLIRPAFNAHRRREYELSIPVLLAQTDGICKETVNQHLFIKQDKKPRTAIYVEQIAADSYRAVLLSPLARTLPISASEYERPEGADALNRHTVLHGESLDYGTETNSLKAISLINYVAHVLKVDSNTRTGRGGRARSGSRLST